MPILVLLLIVVPIAELYVIIQVGQLIGIWPTLALLLAAALLGSWLLKHQGRTAWRRFNEALAQRRFPGKEVADGVLIVVGGTLLLTPGFLSDIVGILLLLPPTRAIARRLLHRFTIGRFAIVNLGGFPGGGPRPGPFGPNGPGGPGGPTERPASRPYDVDGTAEEVPPDDQRQLPRD